MPGDLAGKYRLATGAMRDDRLSPSAKVVIHIIVDLYGRLEGGVAIVSDHYLTQLTGVKERQLAKARRQLEDGGYFLTKAPRREGKATRYYINFENEVALALYYGIAGIFRDETLPPKNASSTESASPSSEKDNSPDDLHTGDLTTCTSVQNDLHGSATYSHLEHSLKTISEGEMRVRDEGQTRSLKPETFAKFSDPTSTTKPSETPSKPKGLTDEMRSRMGLPPSGKKDDNRQEDS